MHAQIVSVIIKKNKKSHRGNMNGGRNDGTVSCDDNRRSKTGA